MLKNILVLLFVLATMVFGFAGDTDNGKHTLRVGINAFPTALNPIYATDETSQAVVNKMHGFLFYFNGRGEIQSGLVKDYRLADGGQTIFLDLRPGFRFSTGKELEAADVVATFNLLNDSRYEYPYRANIAFIKEFKAQDRYRLRLDMAAPHAVWRNYLTFPVLDSKAIEGLSPEKFRAAIPAGLGPYRVKRVQEPERVILELRQPDACPGMYREIEYLVVTNTQLTPLKLVNNEIDICELQPENVEAYRDIPAWQKEFDILKYQKFGYTYLVFNLRNNRIDLNLRRYFYNLLINGQFLEKFLRGRGEKVTTPFLLLNSGITPVSLPVSPLKEEVKIRLATNAESRLRKELVLFLRDELKPFNISIDPVFLEYHSFLKLLRDANFDAAVSGFVLDIDYDMKEIFYREAYFNYARLVNPRMDELLDRGLKEMDGQKRRAIYTQAHQTWLEELPLLPLFNLYYFMGVSRKIPLPQETFRLVGSLTDFLFNIQDWRF